VCDLKHYKSGNVRGPQSRTSSFTFPTADESPLHPLARSKHTRQFALRWRTEGEVLSGAGEETCGNTRCPHHRAHGSSSATNRLRQGWPTDADAERESVPLVTLELPFSYVEGGESKFALVKVVLCDKCRGKLMWKRRKEKEEREREGVVLGVQAGNERDGEGVAAGEDVSGDVRGKVHEGSEERARRHARKRHREHDRDAEEGREITRRRHSRRSSRSRSPEGRLIVPPHSRNHS
jgi:protein FRA10AC1